MVTLIPTGTDSLHHIGLHTQTVGGTVSPASTAARNVDVLLVVGVPECNRPPDVVPNNPVTSPPARVGLTRRRSVDGSLGGYAATIMERDVSPPMYMKNMPLRFPAFLILAAECGDSHSTAIITNARLPTMQQLN